MDNVYLQQYRLSQSNKFDESKFRQEKKEVLLKRNKSNELVYLKVRLWFMQKSRQKVILVAVVIGALGLFLFYDYVYMPFQEEVVMIDEEISIKKKTLQQYMAIAGQKYEYETMLDKIKEAGNKAKNNLLQGKTESLAGAELQTAVKNIVQKKNGTITSERFSGSEDKEGLKVMTITLDVELVNVAALHEILYEIAESKPPMVVDYMEIRVKNLRAPDSVNVRLNISALARVK